MTSAVTTARLAFSSVGHFIPSAASGEISLRRDRLGHLYRACDDHVYRVFRETVKHSGHPIQDPVVLVVGFHLKVIHANPILHQLFQRACITTTPFWSGFEGFGTKLWLAGEDTKSYLGIYEWDGMKNAQVYVNALMDVLDAVSIEDSVWYDLHPNQDLASFLAARRVLPEPAPAPDAGETKAAA